ncbi:MAG: 1-acyl-sn-glycerol-3-phosphate acyltransferase [Pseudomonadota bacterium]
MQKFCHFVIFRVLGWKMIGTPPQLKKYLFVALPHTSNWDFVIGWMVSVALGLNLRIFVKDVFFVWPINHVCHWLGLLPVNRRESTNFTESVAEIFASADELHALITPEGTRAFQPNLKSGYYHLAKKAGIKIVVAGPHFGDKTFTFTEPRDPLPTFEEDAAQVIEFCRSQQGYYPDRTFQ